MLILQGVALVLRTDGHCEPTQQRGMYNKLPILLFALSKRNEYDQVLILDADAMIYNLSSDVTQLINDDDILAGHRVNPIDSEMTWNINNGVTLWNLDHPMTAKVARNWFRYTVDGLNDSTKENGPKDHGDQFYLHRVLKRDKKLTRNTRSLPVEFKYLNATVIKHFVRSKNNFWNDDGMEKRENNIKQAVAEICREYPTDCEELDETRYSSSGDDQHV
jgi:hypothetical protein